MKPNASNTIRAVLYASLMSVALFSCSDREPNVQTVIVKPEERVIGKKDSAFRQWFGHYSYHKEGTEVNNVRVGVEYTIDLDDSVCVFKGSGYQVYFEYICKPALSGDTLFLREMRDVSYDEDKPAEKQYNTLLIRQKNGYQLCSELIPGKVMDVNRTWTEDPWKAHYYCYVSMGRISDIGIGWSYTIDYTDSSCIFEVEGYQYWAKFSCKPVRKGDTLFLNEDKSIAYDKEEPLKTAYKTKIVRKNNRYFMQTLLIPEEATTKPGRLGYELEKSYP